MSKFGFAIKLNFELHSTEWVIALDLINLRYFYWKKKKKKKSKFQLHLSFYFSLILTLIYPVPHYFLKFYLFIY